MSATAIPPSTTIATQTRRRLRSEAESPASSGCSGRSSGIMASVSQPPISRHGVASSSTWLLSDSPIATPTAPSPAPANEPRLHDP